MAAPRSSQTMVHLIGFGGSALIILSVTMRSVWRLRVLALIGSWAFIVYGTVLAAWPIVLTNIVTASIHVFQLRALTRSRSRHATRPRRRRRAVADHAV